MAEEILRRMLQRDPSRMVSSAGTHAREGTPATEFAILASREQGLDITGHTARLLDIVMVRSSDLIICMEPLHIEWVLSLDSSVYERVYNLADYSGAKRLKMIDDPYGCSLREYRDCFRIIAECLENFISAVPSIDNAKNLFGG